MPALAFLATIGIALIALLFVADATLERSLPVMLTSDRVGLPERWHPDTIQIFTTAIAPEPEPDTTSPPALAARPKPEPDVLEKIEPAARAARAEAPPKNRHVTQPIDHRQNHY